MKKYGAMVAALIAALIGLATLAPAANAATSTYPSPTVSSSPGSGVTVSASGNGVTSGNTFAWKATSNTAGQFTATFNGTTKTSASDVTSTTFDFTAPTVTKATVYSLTVSFTAASTSGTSGNAIAVTAASWTQTYNITVYPVGTAASGTGTADGLPNTGGPSAWWLTGGLLAILAGAVAIFSTRRKSSLSA